MLDKRRDREGSANRLGIRQTWHPKLNVIRHQAFEHHTLHKSWLYVSIYLYTTQGKQGGNGPCSKVLEGEAHKGVSGLTKCHGLCGMRDLP